MVSMILDGAQAVIAQGVPRSATGSPGLERTRQTTPPPLARPLSARPGSISVTPAWLAEHDDPPFTYAHEVHWSTDGRHLVLSTVDRQHPNGKVETFEVASGARVNLATGRSASHEEKGRCFSAPAIAPSWARTRTLLVQSRSPRGGGSGQPVGFSTTYGHRLPAQCKRFARF